MHGVRQHVHLGLALGHEHAPEILKRLDERVDEGDQTAAAHHELVDREGRTFGDATRMHHQQGLDLGIDRFDVEAHLTDVEIALELADEGPFF